MTERVKPFIMTAIEDPSTGWLAICVNNFSGESRVFVVFYSNEGNLQSPSGAHSHIMLSPQTLTHEDHEAHEDVDHITHEDVDVKSLKSLKSLFNRILNKRKIN